LAGRLRRSAAEWEASESLPDRSLATDLITCWATFEGLAAEARAAATRVGVDLAAITNSLRWLDDAEQRVAQARADVDERRSRQARAESLLTAWAAVGVGTPAAAALRQIAVDGLAACRVVGPDGDAVVDAVLRGTHPLCRAVEVQAAAANNARPPEEAYAAVTAACGPLVAMDLMFGRVRLPSAEPSDAVLRSEARTLSPLSEDVAVPVTPAPADPPPEPTVPLGHPSAPTAAGAAGQLSEPEDRTDGTGHPATESLAATTPAAGWDGTTPIAASEATPSGSPSDVNSDPLCPAESNPLAAGADINVEGRPPPSAVPIPAETSDWTALPVMFDEYRAGHRTDSNATVVPVRADAGAVDRWGRAAGVSAERQEWAQLFLLSAAIEAAGGTPSLASADVRAATRLLLEPRSTEAGQDPMRGGLRDEAGVLAASGVDVLRLVLHALRPGPADFWTDAEVKELVAAAGIQDGRVRRVVRHLLARVGKVGAGQLPVDELRDQLARGVPPTVEQAREQLAAARQAFKTFMDGHRSIGGRVQRTHCRQAWRRFIEQVEPSTRQLLPPMHKGAGVGGGAADWDVTATQEWIDRLTVRHQEVADDGGAKLTDRDQMDKAARSMAAHATAVNDAMRVFKRARAPSSEAALDREVAEAATALSERLAATAATEELARVVLARTLAAGPSGRASAAADVDDPLRLTSVDFLARPLLLDCVGGVAEDVSTTVADLATADAGDGTGLSRAADVLADPAAAVSAADRALRAGAVVAALADRLANADRPDLLWRLLLTTHPRPADDPLRLLLDRLNTQAQDRLTRRVAELMDWAVQLDDLAWQHAGRFRQVCLAARDVADQFDVRPIDPRLFTAWLDAWSAVAAGRGDRLVGELRRDAVGRLGDDPAALAAVVGLIDRRRYAAARRAMADGDLAAQGETASVRQTPWRVVAAEEWPDPDRMLEAQRGFDPSLIVRDGLIEKWRQSNRGPDSARAVSSRFAAFAFADVDPPAGEDDRHPARDVEAVTAYFRRQGLNPTYVPQLAERFRRLAVATVFTDRGVSQEFGQQAFTQRVVAAVAHHPDDMVFVLVPGLARKLRGQLRQRLGALKRRAAVIDDLDLLRLINPGGPPTDRKLGLLELFLEQQDRAELTPFNAADGQHVRLEMFTGRQAAAEALAVTNTYSRVFSGRKLGKSALLRYVSERYDGHELPSGLTLRVLFVPVVGSEEDAVVDAVVDQLGRLFGVPAAAGGAAGAAGGDGSPARRLDRVVRGLLDAQPRTSLLIVLDEADEFVAQQVARHRADGPSDQAGVSWAMRQLEQVQDGRGLARIRFVCSGYKVTNTREGAWGNWGERLLLNPLLSGEAEALVAGPLARMGIDATDQAQAIAFRCGDQPAVIMQAGRELLKQLQGSRRLAGERVTVTAADVTAVFNSPDVRREIRGIVKMNFLASPQAEVVFNVALLEFADRPVGATLADAPQRVVDRLAAIGHPPDWLGPGGAARNQIQLRLYECVERKLLNDCGDGCYQLAVPHHLELLLQQPDHEAYVHGLAADLARDVSRSDAPVRSLLPAAELAAMAEMIAPTAVADLGVRVVVFGTDWPAAAAHHNGVLKRLARQPDPGPADLSRLAAALADLRPPATPELTWGGPAAVRWAIDHEDRGDGVVCCGLRRVGRAHLHWWLHTVRGIEFVADPSAAVTLADLAPVDRILQLTGGVPRLVDRFERLVIGSNAHGDVTIAAADLAAICRQFERDRPAVLAGLAADLCAREWQLLNMVVAASGAAQTPAELADWLTGDWESVAADVGWADPPPPLSAADGAAVGVLHELGQLIATADVGDVLRRTAPLAADDPVAVDLRAAAAAAGWGR
jgi:hypothetical protein